MATSLPRTAEDHLRHVHHPPYFPTDFPDSPSVYTPDASELDEESASTIRSLSTEDLHDNPDVDDCFDDASHRISLQGPKIKFHSRAPWETDDLISHADESDNSPRSATFGSKLKGKAARADTLIRTFTRGSSRPSIDSTRSQVSATSLETTAGHYLSSRGAIYDLARQSMSTASLSSSTASVSTRNPSFARAANYPEPSSYFNQPPSLSRTAVSLDGMVPPSMSHEPAPIRLPSSAASHLDYDHSAKPFPVRPSQERHSLHDDFVHPYANPDLVVPYTPSAETLPSLHPISGDISGSDSNCTVTDSTSIRSAALSALSTETSTTSLPSRDLPQGTLRVNGKEISSPICVLHQNDNSFVGRNTRFLSMHPPPPGFDAPQRINPTVTLLTLQEAQARERLRNNTIHTTFPRSEPPLSNVDDIPELAEEQSGEADFEPARTRARSTSVGTQAWTVPAQSQNSETTVECTPASSVNVTPARALKHKKSGFMRLFGGRNSEEKSPPPLALSYVDMHAERSSQVHGSGKPSKLTRSRVPKPSSSPALRGSSASNTSLTWTNSTSSSDGTDGKAPSSRKRQAPSLSIVTKTSDQGIGTSVTGISSPMSLNFTPSLPLSLSVPLSAPPGNSDFPGLQLRPISGSFSAHFADIVTSVTEDPQRDVRTPSSATSSNTALSPFTPVSIRRSDDAPATAIDLVVDDNLSIKGLQDQLASAKKAWQQQIWELRGQIRILTAELEGFRAADNREYCEVCGRGEPQNRHLDEEQSNKLGVVNRPRARTGDATRFVNGN